MPTKLTDKALLRMWNQSLSKLWEFKMNAPLDYQDLYIM
jgi:hypothetical protein